MLVHQFLEKSANKFPDKESVVYNQQRISFRELDNLANQLANRLLEVGIKKGDRVAFVLENSVQYIVSFFAVLKMGGITVAQNTLSGGSYLKEVFSDSEISAVITQKLFAQKVRFAIENLDSLVGVLITEDCPAFEEWVQTTVTTFDEILSDQVVGRPNIEIDEREIACIVYTSGSTGKPRGVTLSHLNLVSNTHSIIEYLPLDSTDRVMAILPFSYSYGQSVLLTHLGVGACLVINNKFAFPKVVLDQMVEEKCTGFSGVPTNFILLLTRTDIKEREFPNLRYVTQAGGAMAPAIVKELRKSLAGHVKIYIMYGQTEASPRLSYFCLDDHPQKLGSIGKAIPNVKLLIKTSDGRVAKSGEEGEIIASGDNIMRGYWGQEKETAMVLKSDGLQTGDLGKIDEEGFIYIVGRSKEMIKSGANRFNAKEIEEVLYSHEGIQEVAVIGIPDEIMGEAVKAFISVNSSCELDEKKIILFCRKNMAPFKVPKFVTILPSLPKNSSGKIMKKNLN